MNDPRVSRRGFLRLLDLGGLAASLPGGPAKLFEWLSDSAVAKEAFLGVQFAGKE